MISSKVIERIILIVNRIFSQREKPIDCFQETEIEGKREKRGIDGEVEKISAR